MMKSATLKKFVVCSERIEKKRLGCFLNYYSIRVNTDCNPLRFDIIADFDTYEEAAEYVDYMRHPEDYFNIDDD